MDAFVVAAGYVTVETAVPGGRANVDLPRGAVVPDDVPPEQVAALLARGDITPTSPPVDFPAVVEIAGEPVTVTPVDDAAVPPGMSVATTLHWVGDDTARAQAALDHEHASESPRATLINRLRAKLS